MSTFIVLGDDAVYQILISLKRDEIVNFRDEIAGALLNFSVGDERSYQPDAAVITRPDGRKTLFRPFTSKTGPGVKIIVDPVSAATNSGVAQNGSTSTKRGKPPTLHGILVVCDEDGLPRGLVNAEEITAYRTSMSVMIPYSWRANTANIVVFGAGKVALWHIRLILGLRGEEIKRITVVNRSYDRACSMIDQFQQENEKHWKSAVVFDCIDYGHAEYQNRLKELIDQADVICCTTPSSHPLFPAQFLKRGAREQQSTFISGIGSWQPEMAELDPALFRDAANAENGAVVVDDRVSALKHSGEIIQSGLEEGQMLELGQVLHSRKQSCGDLSQNLEQILRSGFVVYKSIGVSMTDLAAANAVLALATEKSRGVSITDF